MNFLKNISAAFKTAGGAVQGAVKVVEEKNRRTALMNRLRTVIRCEEKAEERAYLALGRYYYHNLRDAENTVTEPYCIDIEAAQKRIDAAVEKLEALTREDDSEAEEEEITLGRRAGVHSHAGRGKGSRRSRIRAGRYRRRSRGSGRACRRAAGND